MRYHWRGIRIFLTSDAVNLIACVPPLRSFIVKGLDLEMKWRISITRAVNAHDNLIPFALTVIVPDKNHMGLTR